MKPTCCLFQFTPSHFFFFFFAFLCDGVACRLHTTSSIYFFHYQLTTRRATYTPHRQFISFTINRRRGVQPTRRVVNLFLSLSIDDAACNLHAALSIYFFYYQLTMRRVTYTPRCLFLYFTINRRHGVQPTCRIVYFFHYHLMMQCATHMLCHLFCFLFISFPIV